MESAPHLDAQVVRFWRQLVNQQEPWSPSGRLLRRRYDCIIH